MNADLVTDGYNSLFDREGVADRWFQASGIRGSGSTARLTDDLKAVRAFLIGECDTTTISPRKIKGRSTAPVIALSEQHSLDKILGLFEAGVDDVIRKPVHIREILARIAAISRRGAGRGVLHRNRPVAHLTPTDATRKIDGKVMPLPRRERRILEHLATNAGRRVTKTQVFNAIYGIFDDEVEEKRRRKPHQQAAPASCARSWATTRSIPNASSATAW